MTYARPQRKPKDKEEPARTKPEDWARIRVAFIRSPYADVRDCKCGWSAQHPRPKVLEDRVDRHLEKRHSGTGVRF